MVTETPRKKAKKSAAKSNKRASRGLPGREAILQFIADNPGKAGKREIGRAFGIKGSAKIDLKAMLRELAEEGLLEKRGKRMIRAGELPSMAVLDIVARDRDGGLLARPEKFDERGGKPPVILVKTAASKIVAGIGTRVLARLERNKGHGVDYYAKIIKIIDRQKDSVLGVLRLLGSEPRVVPITKRGDEIIIAIDALNGAKDGDLVEVEPLKTPGRAGRGGRGASRIGLKKGRISRVIGSVASEKVVSMIAIYANEIPHIFADDVLGEAHKVKPIDLKSTRHEDWRHLPLLTIDPADAKDHDDAIFAEYDKEKEGGFIVTVAIADVGWYVRSGGVMDREALNRGNSVYFPDRVVPMLPERISNDLCSLRQDEDRPALAVRMWFDHTGKKIRHEFHRIIMRSHAKLSYVETQAAIDGSVNEKTAELVEPVLKPLWQTYACLTKGRNARAPLELDLPERKIILKDDGTVDRVTIPARLDAHKLVEEFMIQANVAAAETLENKKQSLIFRVHDQPSPGKMESLSEFLKSMNLSIIRSGNLRAEHFNGVLRSVNDTEHEELVNQIVLRSQSAAEYSPENIGHFGLNLQRYAHFTSPIRRYADLIVHRALIATLGLGEGGITPDEEAQLDVIAINISMTERRAMQAERETIDRLIAGYLSEHIGQSFHGRINGVTNAGLFVTLADSGADGFVPISKISNEYYHFDPATHSLIGEDSNLVYQMGMDVEVRLVEAAPVAGALRFEMLSDGKAAKGLRRTRRSNQRRGAANYRPNGISGKSRKGRARR